jgi:uncharacterized membrane protein
MKKGSFKKVFFAVTLALAFIFTGNLILPNIGKITVSSV